MKISEQILKNHGDLSQTSAKFLKYAKENREIFTRSSFDNYLNDKDTQAILPPFTRCQPWPTFINKEKAREIEKVSSGVYDLIKSIPRRIFDYDVNKISAYYGYPRSIAKLMLDGIDDFIVDSLLARGDFVFANTKWQCLEFNVQSNSGGWQLDIQLGKMKELPIMIDFFKSNGVTISAHRFFYSMFKHLVEVSIKRDLPIEGGLNIAFVLFHTTEEAEQVLKPALTEAYEKVLKEKGIQSRGEVIICCFDHLIQEGDCVFYKEKQIQQLVEMCNGMVPSAILKIAQNGKLHLFNGPVSKLLSEKLNLAILSENQDSELFTPEERESIQKHIPWTRKVAPVETLYQGMNVQLEDLMLCNQENLVLKSSYSVSGKDVYIGKNVLVEEWEKRVEKAIKEKNWVVQEYVRPSTYMYQADEEGYAPFQAVWGFFLFGRSYAGGFVRILPETNKVGVINSSQGAEESILIEVGE